MKEEPVYGETLWLRMAWAREFLDDFFNHFRHVWLERKCDQALNGNVR